MARAFRQQIDEGILNRAAALFARYGFSQTSVQAVADAVGMSKAGLLHYFPSKDALREAVVARSQALDQEVLDQVAHLPLGPARDRLAIEALVDQALAHPGLVAFLLSFVASLDPAALAVGADSVNSKVFQAFNGDTDVDAERTIRVVGALAALSMLVLFAHQAGKSTAWRAQVIATSYDALGHH